MFIYWISGESGCLVSSTDASKAVGQKFTTHADYRALKERYEALKVTEREGYAEYHRTRVELASIKARAADYERAVTEQAMLTECVSVTGRDPSDVLRDVIKWHVSNAAQPVEALDDYTSEGFAEWINSAYSFKGDGSFTRFNMEVAYAAGRERAALAHPRPTVGSWSVKVPASRMEEAILSMQEPDGEALDGTLWLGQLDDGAYGVHLSCDECPEEGSITLAVLPAPTSEQAWEVIDWTDDDVETLRCLRDAVGKYANLKKLWVPTIEKMLTRARHVENATAMPYAQPRPVGVPEGYRLVPVEPTDDMCRNAREKIGIGSNVAHHVWHWMIAAAPDGEVG